VDQKRAIGATIEHASSPLLAPARQVTSVWEARASFKSYPD
jgi:hypothetical protein